MIGPFIRQYATVTSAGTHCRIPLIKKGVVDFAVGADYTPSAGDVKVSKDGGAAANIGTLPTAVVMGNTTYWEFHLSASELTCRNLAVTISDNSTAIEDQMFVVETFGNNAAQFRTGNEDRAGAYYRPYNSPTSGGRNVRVPMQVRGGVRFAAAADWTPSAGDVKLSKDGGAAANITTLPTAVAMGNTAYWEFSFTGSELACTELVVSIADAATKAVEDNQFNVETYVVPSSGCQYLTYGTYEFPLGFYLSDKGRSWLVPSQKVARGDGARDQVAFREGRRVIISGKLFSDSADLLSVGTADLRTKVDALAAALASQPQSLYVESDRYWRNARVRTMPEVYGPTGQCRFTEDISVEFAVADPFEYSVTSNTITWSSPVNGSTTTVTAGGTAYALPSIVITLGGVGATSLDITLTNTTTIESFRLVTDSVTGTLNGGDVITVDCLNQTVTIAGVDRMDLFDGEWISLSVGSNTWSLSRTLGTIASIVPTWANRYH
jgi:phage-related protein